MHARMLPPTAALPVGNGQEQHSMCGMGASSIFGVPILGGSPTASPTPISHSPSSANLASMSMSMDFAQILREVSVDVPMMPPCGCCRPSAQAQGRQATPALVIHTDPQEVGRADDERVGIALQRMLGSDGLLRVFGLPSAAGARRIKCRGMNHIFMVAHGGRLAKCVRPQAEHFSEAREAERLKRETPSLAADEHVVFPLAAFTCQSSSPFFQNAQPYEITVFEYLDGCRSVGDLVRAFERTHPSGVLQGTAACASYRSSGSCEHVAPLRHLLVNQVARLSARFQALHGRRHGDLKADNVLIDRRGVPRFADFLSPFCMSCDREEFITSVASLHPTIKSFHAEFDRAWQAERRSSAHGGGGERGNVLEPSDAAGNVRLMDALERLQEASKQQPMFGPIPSLLSGLGLPGTSPALAPTPSLSFSVPPSLDPSPLSAGALSPGRGRRSCALPGCGLGGAGPGTSVVFGPSPLNPSEQASFQGFPTQFPFTGLPSPTRGLRSPASPSFAGPPQHSPSPPPQAAPAASPPAASPSGGRLLFGGGASQGGASGAFAWSAQPQGQQQPQMQGVALDATTLTSQGSAGPGPPWPSLARGLAGTGPAPPMAGAAGQSVGSAVLGSALVPAAPPHAASLSVPPAGPSLQHPCWRNTSPSTAGGGGGGGGGGGASTPSRPPWFALASAPLPSRPQ